MIRALTPLGVRVPDGFALTADAYRAVLEGPGVQRALRDALARLDHADVESLRAAGAAARRAIREAPLPEALMHEVGEAYAALSRQSREFLPVDGVGLTLGALESGSLGSLSQRVVTAARRPVLVVH
jgi:pyruvate,water dikinase